MPMEASGGPPIYCFVLVYYLNLLLYIQFDKLYPWTLNNSTPEDQTEKKTTNPRLQDLSAKKIRDSEMKEYYYPENKTSRPINNTSEISISKT